MTPPKAESYASKAATTTAAASASASKDKGHLARAAQGESISVGVSGDFLEKEIKKFERAVSSQFTTSFNQGLESLYRRFDQDKRIQSAAADAKQDAVLRLVSSTLSENVETSLSRIITHNLQAIVVPAVGEVIAKTLERQLPYHLNQQLSMDVRAVVPDAINRVLSTPDFLRSISTLVSQPLATQIEAEFKTSLRNTILPVFQREAERIVLKTAHEVDSRNKAHMQELEKNRHSDTVKIDQLTQLVRGLGQTIQTMAKAQSEFQEEIRKLQRQGGMQSGRGTPPQLEDSSAKTPAQTPQPEPTVPKTAEEIERENILSLLADGRIEEGTVTVCSSYFIVYL